MARSLWLVMQVIETNRHSAEQLETAAAIADPDVASLLNEIAAQSRRFADEIYEAMKSGNAAAESDDESSPPLRRRAAGR
jgi:hypothetical protein